MEFNKRVSYAIESMFDDSRQYPLYSTLYTKLECSPWDGTCFHLPAVWWTRFFPSWMWIPPVWPCIGKTSCSLGAMWYHHMHCILINILKSEIIPLCLLITHSCKGLEYAVNACKPWERPSLPAQELFDSPSNALFTWLCGWIAQALIESLYDCEQITFFDCVFW